MPGTQRGSQPLFTKYNTTTCLLLYSRELGLARNGTAFFSQPQPNPPSWNPTDKKHREKEVQIYSCVTPQTRSCFWRGECLIWYSHSYTIKFMWGRLTSPWDEPLRNSVRRNWGRDFFLPPPFILILLAPIYLNINTVFGYRQNTWIKHSCCVQGDEVFSCSRRVTAVSSVQESNIHTLGILGVCGEVQEAQIWEFMDRKSQSTEITRSLFMDVISISGSDPDPQQT